MTQITGGFGDDNLTGNGLDNVLLGSAGNDSLQGGAGNDVFLDGVGNNSFRGDGGSDTYVLNPGSAVNTIDLRSPDTATDIARLQGVRLQEIIAIKDGDDLQIGNGLAGEAGLEVVVTDWFATDAPTHLQFVTSDGFRFQVTTDAEPVIEVLEQSFASSSTGVDSDLIFITPSLGDVVNRNIRLADGVSLRDSPQNDSLKGNEGNNTFISTKGNDILEGRSGRDIYIVNDTDDLENPHRDRAVIVNRDFEGQEEDTLFLPHLASEELVVMRSTNILHSSDLIVGRYNADRVLVPLAQIQSWLSGGERYQHLKVHTRDGVFHINGDGTLRRDGVDFSGNSTGQTYDSLQDDRGGQVLSITGSQGNDTLRGDGQTNVFNGLGGRDVYEGRDGQDIYVIGSETPGQDVKVIVNAATDGLPDVIEIGVARDKLAFARVVDQDLYLVSATATQPADDNAAEWEKIAYGVVQQFFVGSDHQHLNLKTADGGDYALQIDEDSGKIALTPLQKAADAAVSGTLDLRDFPDTASATDSPGNDEIVGNALDNTISSSSGNDSLKGGAGRDTYVLRRTDGAGPREVTIDNRADDIVVDLLYIETDAENLQSPVRDGDDLILSDGGDFARIKIVDWFSDDSARHLQVATQDNYLFSLAERDNEGYLVLDQVNFAKADSGQRFDASVNPGDRIDYSNVEIRGTQYSDQLVGGSGNNTIIPNGGYDEVTGGDGYDLYQVDLTAPKAAEWENHSINIDNFAVDGLRDTVYLANVNYSEILPGVLSGNLYLAQVPDPDQRSSLGHTLGYFFLQPPEATSFPDTVNISKWTEREPIATWSLSLLMASPLPWMPRGLMAMRSPKVILSLLG